MVLQEVSLLEDDELRILLADITKRLEKSRRFQGAFARFKGRGKGVWQQDAQQYINQLRSHDRI